MPGQGMISADPFQLTGIKAASRAMSPGRAIYSPAASMKVWSSPLVCRSSRCSGANLSQKGSRVGDAGASGGFPGVSGTYRYLLCILFSDKEFS